MMARRPARPRRTAPSLRRARRAPRRLTPLLLLGLLAALGAVALERMGQLPGPMADVVREVEETVLAPLLRELGVEWPGTAALPGLPLRSGPP